MGTRFHLYCYVEFSISFTPYTILIQIYIIDGFGPVALDRFLYQTASFESTRCKNPEGWAKRRRFIQGFRVFGHGCLLLQGAKMVVSNKKVKQKLGSTLAESLAVAVAGTAEPNTNDSTSTSPELNPLSLQNLLSSESQKPRLPKREKRRKTLPLQGPDIEGTSIQKEEKEAHTEALIDDGNDTEKKNKKNKKRKRDGEVGLEENKNKDLKKKNKKKKKKKKKSKKKQKTEGQNKGVENEGVEKELVKEAVQINYR